MWRRGTKRAAYVLAGMVAALAGCRGVIGIEELTVATDGGPGTGAETGVDAKVDASVIEAAPDGPAQSCAARGGECRRCCRDEVGLTMLEFAALELVSADAGCLCPACPDCAATVCASPPVMGMNMLCNICLDELFAVQGKSNTPPCMSAKMRCGQNASCAKALSCLDSCTN